MIDWDKHHFEAKQRMARYDALPSYKRSFVQRNHEFFTEKEFKKYTIDQLRRARGMRVQYIMKKLYGKDHPSAGGQ
jgi:hypothetical protein